MVPYRARPFRWVRRMKNAFTWNAAKSTKV
jgi:hypothetical protein